VADTVDTNILKQFLRDLSKFVDLLVKLVSDEETSKATFGFSVDIGIVSELDAVVQALDAAADGKGDLTEYVAAAARLAEVTDAVQLLVQAVEADLPPGLIAEEAVGVILDTAGLAYVSTRWPALLYLARLFGLFAENVTFDQIGAAVSEGWKSLSGPLDTEDDARQMSRSLAAIGLGVALTPWLVDHFLHKRIDPLSLVVLHGWEPDPASSTPQADEISKRFVTILVRVSGESEVDGTPVETEAELTLTLAWVPRDHGGPGLWVSLGLGAGGDLHLGSGWHLVLDWAVADALDVFLARPDDMFVRGGAAVGGEIELRLERRDEGTDGGPAQPWRLGEVLEVKAAELAVRLGDRDPILEAVLRVRDAALVVPRPEKGFFRSLVPEGGLRLEFDLGMVVDSTPRFYLEGGTGLEVTIPIRTSTPKLQGLHVFLALRTRLEGQETGPALTFEASGGFSTRIGSFSATVDRFGVILPEAPHGLPGAPWLKLPSAIGVGIDGELVKGGGFILFDPDRGRYAGVLALTIRRWSLTAFGLLTDLPDGYSLLIVVSLELRDSPLTGPFGITLTGLGGVLGHNHGADVAALQAAMRTGAVRTMLFPADPIAAAPRVLTTLGTVFPVRPGSSLLGIGVKLTWSHGLVSLVAALIFESGPTPRIVVLASLEAVAPSHDLPLVRLRVDAVGIIDTKRPSVEIDGSLVESFIGPYALTGDGTFRFHGGDDGLFLLAVGGFHPSYVPPPAANLPPQRRITLALPTDNPRLRLEQYWAVTSNTIQMGARLEVSARKAGFSAEALLGFDALVQRSPFHLTVDIEGRAAIRYDGSTLASVGLDLHVDGPSPWLVVGKAKLSLLFFSITIPIDYDSGDEGTSELVQSADAAAALSAALADPANWETTEPVGAAALVSLRSTVAPGELAAHPAGRLGVRQSVLPLGVELTHLGPARVAADRFDVESVTVNGTAVAAVTELRAPFAAGEYVDLSADERLSRPAFERFVAGFTAGGERVVSGPATSADLTYEEIVMGPDGPIDETPPRRPALAGVLAHAAALGAAATSPLRRDDIATGLRATPRVTLSEATRLAVDAVTLQQVPVPDGPADATETELRQALAGLSGVLLVQSHEAVGVG